MSTCVISNSTNEVQQVMQTAAWKGGAAWKDASAQPSHCNKFSYQRLIYEIYQSTHPPNFNQVQPWNTTYNSKQQYNKQLKVWQEHVHWYMACLLQQFCTVPPLQLFRYGLKLVSKGSVRLQCPPFALQQRILTCYNFKEEMVGTRQEFPRTENKQAATTLVSFHIPLQSSPAAWTNH